MPLEQQIAVYDTYTQARTDQQGIEMLKLIATDRVYIDAETGDLRFMELHNKIEISCLLAGRGALPILSSPQVRGRSNHAADKDSYNQESRISDTAEIAHPTRCDTAHHTPTTRLLREPISMFLGLQQHEETGPGQVLDILPSGRHGPAISLDGVHGRWTGQIRHTTFRRHAGHTRPGDVRPIFAHMRPYTHSSTQTQEAI